MNARSWFRLAAVFTVPLIASCAPPAVTAGGDDEVVITEVIDVSAWLVDSRPDAAADEGPQRVERGEVAAPPTMRVHGRDLPANTYLLDEAACRAMMARAHAGEGSLELVTSPRLLVRPGEPASIAVADAETTVALMVTAWPAPDGAVTLAARAETGGEAGTTVELEPFVLPAGTASSTVVMRAPDGSCRLLLLTAARHR